MSNEVEQRVLTMTDKLNLEKELEELRQAKLDVPRRSRSPAATAI